MAKIEVDQAVVEANALRESPSAHELVDHPYAEFLPRVTKPGRYLGGEEQSIIKSDISQLSCRFVLAFPDLYEIGMSHLGTRIIYDLVNRHEDLACERAFSPWRDMEEVLRSHELPLVSLETYTALRDFDVVGVSLQYELSYTNVLLNLDLGGVPLRRDARRDADPIVIAGGPTATHPEPLVDFIDAFLVGEAEEVLPGLLRTIGQLRRAGRDRRAVLEAVATTPGMYVPEMYERAIDAQSGFMVVTGPTQTGERLGVPAGIARAFVRDLADFPFPRSFPVPYAEAVFDRASVEITRGCTEGCRFCQAGMIYRPVREREPEEIINAVLEGTDLAGFDETSLTALSTADVSCISPLIKGLVPELAKRKVTLGIASLRAYGLSPDMLDEIKRVGIDGLTFAPEAGTQRMRNVINKNVSEEDILQSAQRIFERGYDRMKLYFIMGLPTETEEDVRGIVETGRRVRRLAVAAAPDRPAKVTVSVSQHVPKPHTPFQWAAMDDVDSLLGKVRLLQDLARDAKVGLKTHTVQESWLECIFARGDARLGRVIQRAYEAGARFDGWKEYFQFSRWTDALEAEGIEPQVFLRELAVDDRVPWDHIDIGFEPDFLAGEWRKALAFRSSPPCGKPAGDQVHHTHLEGPDGALAEKRRLVCYDCGVACDLQEMKDERIVALADLEARSVAETKARAQARSSGPAPDSTNFVSLDRLKGRLASSKLADDHIRKHNAEAPYSRLRIFFAKHASAAYLSHLDLVRMFPRMFRRAGIDLAFSRGFKAQPRMTFGPALALGVSAWSEAVDVDVILPNSARDMLGELEPAERRESGAALFEALQGASPPGITIQRAELLPPDSPKLAHLVSAMDFRVRLGGTDEVAHVARRLEQLAVGEALVVQREKHPKRRRPKAGRRRGRTAQPQANSQLVEVDRYLQLVELTEAWLRFRVVRATTGTTPRPREVAALLLGRTVSDHDLIRECLLAQTGEAFESLADLDVDAWASAASQAAAGESTHAEAGHDADDDAPPELGAWRSTLSINAQPAV